MTPGTLQRLRHALWSMRRRRAAAPPVEAVEGTVGFECNLCGFRNRVVPAMLHREISSCGGCGSTVRFRSIGHLVVREMLGCEVSLPQAGLHRDIHGIGLSDAHCYAMPLAACFDYTNTFFHTGPRLDITEIPDELAHRFDFVVASEVFEHVAPPVSRAFRGARRLLRRGGGVLILTVPFGLGPDTVEHFPDLFEYRIERTGEQPLLHNTTRDGRQQRFDRLVFHGGAGSTLEMREFSRDGLVRELRSAGFSDVRFCREPCERFGIVWPEPWSMPIVARA